MSMPNIPDICPNIDISFEDSVNSLLTSIAMEEISLSKLMDAETQKIKYVLEKHKCISGNLEDVISVNNSVNATIINMSKMQMLLHWKLENVERLIPKCRPCPPKPPCPPNPPCPKPPNKCCCGVTGKASGCIRCSCNEFWCAKVVLRAHVFSCEKSCKNSLSLHVSKSKDSLSMNACPNDICIECPSNCEPNTIVIKGKGKAERIYKCDEEEAGNVDFQLTVWDNPPCKEGFHIVITSCINSLKFDSGFVSANNCDNWLRISK